MKDEIVALLQKKRDLLARAAEIAKARHAGGARDELDVIEAEVRLCDAEMELARTRHFMGMDET